MIETIVKKYLLIQKPEATLMYIRHGHAYYQTSVITGIMADDIAGIAHMKETIAFKIPVDDMGSTDFLPIMPGQSLLRWIYLPEN